MALKGGLFLCIKIGFINILRNIFLKENKVEANKSSIHNGAKIMSVKNEHPTTALTIQF